MAHKEAISDQKQRKQDGTQFFLEGYRAEALFGDVHFLLFPCKQALQQQAHGKEEQSANGDAGESLGVDDGFLQCLDLCRNQEP